MSERHGRTLTDQNEMFCNPYEKDSDESLNYPVKCLGIMFQIYNARRDYFLQKLREGCATYSHGRGSRVK